MIEWKYRWVEEWGAYINYVEKTRKLEGWKCCFTFKWRRKILSKNVILEWRFKQNEGVRRTSGFLPREHLIKKNKGSKISSEEVCSPYKGSSKKELGCEGSWRTANDTPQALWGYAQPLTWNSQKCELRDQTDVCVRRVSSHGHRYGQ